MEWLALAGIIIAILWFRSRRKRRIAVEAFQSASAFYISPKNRSPEVVSVRWERSRDIEIAESYDDEKHDDDEEDLDHDDDPDDGNHDIRYRDFVRKHWSMAGVSARGITINRITGRTQQRLELHSLVNYLGYTTYVNAWVDGEMTTFAGDARCRWSRDGKLFKARAFSEAFESKNPDLALRHESHPDFYEHPLPPSGSLSGLVYTIEYADGYGVVTTRVFRLETIFDNLQNIQLTGFCYLRDDVRTLRLDRILNLSDHRTGRPIVSPADYFAPFLAPNSERNKPHAKVMKLARGGLDVLTWVANADGGLRDVEVGILLKYVAERAGLSVGQPDAWMVDAAEYWIRQRQTVMANMAPAVHNLGKKEAVLVMTTLHRLRTECPSHLLEGRFKKVEKLLRLKM